MELPLFDEVAEALRGIVPSDLGTLRYRVRRYGIKAWFGAGQPPREHYEAQVIGAEQVPGARILALEVGFHAEHPDPAENDAVMRKLDGGARRWRRHLGTEPVIGPFLGRPGDWRRLSETWSDPDLESPELRFELAARLTDYMTALEPVRRSRKARRGQSAGPAAPYP